MKDLSKPTLDPALAERLGAVHFDGMKKSIVGLKMVAAATRDGGRAMVSLVLPSPEHPQRAALEADVRAALTGLDGVTDVELKTSWSVGEGDFSKPPIPGVKNVIAVASGKGGVGKSTVASNLAVGLAQMGAATGLLDLDIYGPSVPIMLGKCETPGVLPGTEKVVPSEAHGVRFLSMGQFAGGDKAVLWRGPMLHRMVGQLTAAHWGELDYLVLDLPPGTGDVQLTLTQTVPLSGAVIVTTPQEIALIDARKGLRMFDEAHVPILGIVENMSWYDCRKCSKRHALFDEGGGARLATEAGVPLLAQLPLVADVADASDAGRPLVLQSDSRHAAPYHQLAVHVAAAVGRLSLNRSPFRVFQ
ncbi:MAG: iron-sulfur cluster carrier protein [Gemmatimonadota bacterium]|nr:MAG: iron-sulfur cluster carrier protein [Gemmatimonadota bacterium]